MISNKNANVQEYNTSFEISIEFLRSNSNPGERFREEKKKKKKLFARNKIISNKQNKNASKTNFARIFLSLFKIHLRVNYSLLV